MFNKSERAPGRVGVYPPSWASAGECDWERSLARLRTAARFTVWPLDSCRNSSSEMVSRSAGQPDALAALTCTGASTLSRNYLLVRHKLLHERSCSITPPPRDNIQKPISTIALRNINCHFEGPFHPHPKPNPQFLLPL